MLLEKKLAINEEKRGEVWGFGVRENKVW